MDEFELDKRLARAAFERAARSYDDAAVLQREVARRMAERLQYLKCEPKRILDAGSGTGYGAQVLREHYPSATIIELDFALEMLRVAARRVWWKTLSDRLRGRHTLRIAADVERLPLAAESVAMVWSNMTLQWCNDLDRAFSEARRVLMPNGLFLFTTFGPDTLKELRAAFSKIDASTHVNRFIDMHDIGDALVRAQFGTPVMDVEHFTLTYHDLEKLMRDLKALGAHNVTHGRRRGLFGRKAWTRLQQAYAEYARDGVLPATYEVVYGHAWKTVAGERSASRDPAVVRLDFPRRRGGQA